MAPALHSRHTGHHLLRPLEKLPYTLTVFPVKPLRIVGCDIHRTPKPCRPLQMRRVEMRMANHNRLQPAFLINKIHSSLVEKGDKVPEHVAVGRLQEDGALADAKLLAGGGGVGEVGG